MTRCKVFLGTYIEISIGDHDGVSKSLALEATHEAFKEIALIQDRMNIHDKDSDLSKMNRLAPLGKTKLQPCIQEVLLMARDLYQQSNGLLTFKYQSQWDCERICCR